MAPTLSIIIPVYKVEPYIAKCIASIKAQQFTDFECIIVDDGSPDNSIKIAKEIAGDDGRFVFLHQANGGQSSARHLGLKHAQGKYIGFVDSDDFIDYDFYLKLVNEAESTQADIVVTLIKLIEPDKEFLFDDGFTGVYESKEIIRHYISSHKIFVASWNKIYRKELFSDLKFYEGISFEDLELEYKLFLNARKISYIKSTYYNYFRRANSIMTSPDAKKVKDWFTVMNARKKYLKEKGIFETFYQEFVTCFFRHAVINNLNIISDSEELLDVFDQEIKKYKDLMSLKTMIPYFFKSEFKALARYKFLPRSLYLAYVRMRIKQKQKSRAKLK